MFLTLWLSRAALVTMISDKIITTKTTTSQRAKLFLYHFFFFSGKNVLNFGQKRHFFLKQQSFSKSRQSFRGKKVRTFCGRMSQRNRKAPRQGINKDRKLLIPPPQLLSEIRLPVDEHPCTDHNNGFLLTNIFPQRFFPLSTDNIFLFKSQYRQLQLRVLVH